MNIVQTFKNHTSGKTVKVVTDSTGTWGEGSEVLTDKEITLGREGYRLTQDQTNKLFAYWHSAGHKIEKE